MQMADRIAIEWQGHAEEDRDYEIMLALRQDHEQNVPPWIVMDRSHRRNCATRGMWCSEAWEIVPLES